MESLVDTSIIGLGPNASVTRVKKKGYISLSVNGFNTPGTDQQDPCNNQGKESQEHNPEVAAMQKKCLTKWKNAS
jgi:hypothetical protein